MSTCCNPAFLAPAAVVHAGAALIVDASALCLQGHETPIRRVGTSKAEHRQALGQLSSDYSPLILIGGLASLCTPDVQRYVHGMESPCHPPGQRWLSLAAGLVLHILYPVPESS